MDEVRRRRTVDLVLLVLLLIVAGLACFISGVIWVADFSDADPRRDVAGFSCAVLAVTIVIALATTAVRRSAKAGSITLLVGLMLAAVAWIGTL